MVENKIIDDIKQHEKILSSLISHITNEIMNHPLMDTINKFVENNEILAKQIREAFTVETLTEIYVDKIDRLEEPPDIDEFTKSARQYIDHLNDELTRVDDDDIHLTYEDLKKLDPEFPKPYFYIVSIIVQYINAYKISTFIRNVIDDNSITSRVIVFVEAYLENILKYAIVSNEDILNQRVHVRDVLHNRFAIKNLLNDEEED